MTLRCATKKDDSGESYTFCTGSKGGGGKSKSSGGKKGSNSKMGKLSDEELMARYGHHKTQAMVNVLRTLVGKDKAGKSLADKGPWTKISKLRKLEKAGGLSKLNGDDSKKKARRKAFVAEAHKSSGPTLEQKQRRKAFLSNGGATKSQKEKRSQFLAQAGTHHVAGNYYVHYWTPG